MFSTALYDTPVNFQSYTNIMNKSDAGWYQKIAEHGYPEIRDRNQIGYSNGPDFTQSSWAFFPCYPYLNKYTSSLFNVDFSTSAFIWSIVFSMLAIIGMYWFGCIVLKNQSTAFLATVLMYCFPFSFYFSAFYTEAMFVTFALFSFISIRYKKYWALSILIIPLTLLRPNGIILLLPLYLYHLEQQGILEKFKISWKALFSGKQVVNSLWFLTGPIVFAMYCFFQYQKTGYYFAFSIAQAGWYREFMFPVLSFFRRGDLATQYNSVFTILVIIYAIWNRKKLPISLNVLIFISLLLPLCSGSVTSMTRFVSVLFPLFFVLAMLIQHKKIKFAIVSSALILHFVSFYFWLIDYPICY